LEQTFSWKEMARRALRPRILVYTAVLWVLIIAAGTSVWLRVPLKVDVIRDRASLARQVDEQHVENVYQLRVMNTDEQAHRFLIRATGLKELQVMSEAQPLLIGAADSKTVPVRLRATIEHAEPGSHRIEFIIEASDAEGHPLPEVFSLHEKSVFIIPR
jgi:polyferredoxin